MRHRPDIFDHIRYWLAAVWDYPRGALCGWCGRPNFFCDDCGWFAITPAGNDTRVACRACYRGKYGQMHTARYGVGER